MDNVVICPVEGDSILGKPTGQNSRHPQSDWGELRFFVQLITGSPRRQLIELVGQLAKPFDLCDWAD